MTPSINLIVPVRTRSEANLRGAWFGKANRAKKHRAAVLLVLRAGATRPVVPCVVRLTRISPCRLDDDNLRGALKSVRDGVAEWLGIDDRDARVHYLYGQEKGAPKTHGVRVEVIERARVVERLEAAS